MSPSISIELYRQVQQIGGRLVLQDGKVRLLAKRESVTPSFLEALKEHRDALALILEKGTWKTLCFGCGKKTTFYPTPSTRDVFREWECGECGWKLWRKEEGEYPSAILKATLQAFPGSAVVYYENHKEEQDEHSSEDQEAD